jgi:hypothetical protein
MNILILNGNPNESKSSFENYLKDLSSALDSIHQTEILTLRDMEIQYCTGCWGCWVKTPGSCVVKDDSWNVCKKVIQSDFVLFASPIRMGFPTALLKSAMDKLIPLVHPYIAIVDNECHHVARYDSYPLAGLLLQPEDSTDNEDIDIISNIFKRSLFNLKSSLCFTKLSTDPIQEVANEINSI